jgi:hypothetical protein
MYFWTTVSHLLEHCQKRACPIAPVLVIASVLLLFRFELSVKINDLEG